MENYYVNCVNFILTSKSQNFKWIFPLLFWNWWWIRPWAIFHFPFLPSPLFPISSLIEMTDFNNNSTQKESTRNLIFTFHQIRACIIKWKKNLNSQSVSSSQLSAVHSPSSALSSLLPCDLWDLARERESTATIISLLCGIFWSFILMVCALCNFDDVIWPLLADVGVESALCAAPVQSSCVLLLFIHSPAMCLSIACVQKIQQIQIWIFPFFSLPRHAHFSIMSFHFMAFASILFAASVEDDVTFIWNCIFTSETKRVVSCWMPEWLHLVPCSSMSTTARSNPFPMPCRTSRDSR